MYGVILLALVAAASANVMVDSSCPDVTPVKNFDYTTYGTGKWYEVARYPNSAEKFAECGETEYTLIGEVTKVRNTHVVHNKLKVIEGYQWLAPDADKTGKVIAALPYGVGGAITEYTFNILKISDEYLIGYYCKYDEEKQIHQDFAWVLSRTKTLSPEARTAVDKYLKESDVLEYAKFVWPSFSDKDCKVEY